MPYRILLNARSPLLAINGPCRRQRARRAHGMLAIHHAARLSRRASRRCVLRTPTGPPRPWPMPLRRWQRRVANPRLSVASSCERFVEHFAHIHVSSRATANIISETTERAAPQAIHVAPATTITPNSIRLIFTPFSCYDPNHFETITLGFLSRKRTRGSQFLRLDRRVAVAQRGRPQHR